ncbi:hypothetical protein [Paenibacillus riograndensis]|uniref:Tc1-like transposase DDE domain-containing protein n=1 Tax=Paenibacillus riograndensis SBR5 TaxID=1073571 RepID=A0A0E4CW87_9BACL|nr:hypothetical protein [Paenibacillus riograndensis]CQR55024.1 hypothetical protein PRIO_2620 [Paenibacillus riograndensis SBR5]
MTQTLSLKKRIEGLHQNPPTDGRVICMDEFGPLSLQPYRGKGWFQQRRPVRLRATFNRPLGVKHLLVTLDLKTDQLYGHASKTKKHQDILRHPYED